MKLFAAILTKRFQAWLPFLAGAVLMLVTLLGSDRVPTGDAPHLLAIADKLAGKLARGEFLDFFESWSSLVTPHPPAGYLLPIALSIADLSDSIPILTGLGGLALAWHGIILMVSRDQSQNWGLWLSALLMFSCALTWMAVEHMVWDVLAAGCVSACVGHLHASDGLRNKGHSLFFGLLMGIGFMTKFTFAGFLILPVLFAGWAVIRFRSFPGLLVSIAGFAAVSAPWLLTYGDAVWAYVANSSSAAHSISDSPASPWAHRLSASNLLYYPTVMRDMIGWPGIGLLSIALVRGWKTPAGRWATWAMLSGLIVLTFAGENQARYILPTLPLLGSILCVGLRPGFDQAIGRFGLLCGLGVTLPALWGSWMEASSVEATPPTRDQDHSAETLFTWGDWPWPATPFRTVSNPMLTWQVDDALVAMYQSTGAGAHQVGLLLPRDMRLPPASTYAWRAGQRGLDWDFSSIVTSGPGGRPMVFVGPLKPLGHNISRRFTVAYAIHSRSEPPPILTSLGAQSVWSHDLPQDLKGTVYRIPDSSWKTPTGELLSKDPLDG